MSKSVQEAELERVSHKIARIVLRFLRVLWADGRAEFHMQDLVRYVQRSIPFTAPDSSSRILRDLRQRGKIKYEVLSRRNSHYKLLFVKPKKKKK